MIWPANVQTFIASNSLEHADDATPKTLRPGDALPEYFKLLGKKQEAPVPKIGISRSIPGCCISGHEKRSGLAKA